mmetsp:Transcript_107488/g.195508  ORF Transcript_107488/g.195508 Transcript_107488/m.195508 type:complete len:245 (+) Transcript_107488:709-1443(+)
MAAREAHGFDLPHLVLQLRIFTWHWCRGHLRSCCRGDWGWSHVHRLLGSRWCWSCWGRCAGCGWISCSWRRWCSTRLLACLCRGPLPAVNLQLLKQPSLVRILLQSLRLLFGLPLLAEVALGFEDLYHVSREVKFGFFGKHHEITLFLPAHLCHHIEDARSAEQRCQFFICRAHTAKLVLSWMLDHIPCECFEEVERLDGNLHGKAPQQFFEGVEVYRPLAAFRLIVIAHGCLLAVPSERVCQG